MADERQTTEVLESRAEPPVPQAKGLPYLRFLRLMHKHLKPDWYLEIGTETGKSLKRAMGKSIAVDPTYRLHPDVIGEQPQVHLFRQESDEFFASGVLERLAGRVDFAFLDGLHLIEQLLRDFINTEAVSGPETVIAIHDVVPLSWIGAERDWDRAQTSSWTGDVWKLVPILRRYRPDLEIFVADCAPSGLLLVRGLDPGNRALSACYDDIVEEFVPLSLEDYGTGKLTGELDLVSARAPEMERFIGPDNVRAPETPALAVPGRIAIRIQAVDARRAPHWGEFNLALGLKSAFEAAGRDVVIQARDAWDDRARGQVDLALWGLRQEGLPTETGAPLLLWLLYNPDAAEDDMIAAASHVFVASEAEANRLGAKVGVDKVSPLLQGFDEAVMTPDGPSVPHGALFVGNGRRKLVRRTVRLALNQGVEIELYGERWAGTDAERFLKGSHIPNAELAAHYRGAGAVLNDHKFGMGANGFVSNRIFDALACGAPVVSDHVDGLPADIAPLVRVYDEEAQFSGTVAQALAESPADRDARRSNAQDLASRHSLASRARRILEHLD